MHLTIIGVSNVLSKSLLLSELNVIPVILSKSLAEVHRITKTRKPCRKFYPAISTFAVQICYTNKFLLYSY